MCCLHLAPYEADYDDDGREAERLMQGISQVAAYIYVAGGGWIPASSVVQAQYQPSVCSIELVGEQELRGISYYDSRCSRDSSVACSHPHRKLIGSEVR